MRLRAISQVRHPRHALLALTAFVAVFALAAKCIENETLYQDSSGTWHVVGEIHNETDVWGAGMILRGQLLDANGAVIATTQTPICPLELAPNTFNGFDLVFNGSAGLQPTGYQINVIDGHVLDQPLPDSGLTLNGFEGTRVGGGVNISGTVASTRTYERILTGCIAFYDASGRVVTHITAINFGLTLPLVSGAPQPVGFTIPEVHAGATKMRIWLAGDSDVPLASDYAAVVTGLITID